MTTPTVTEAIDKGDGFPLVLLYSDLGWALTRAAKDSKVPIDHAWQSAPVPTERQLRDWFEHATYNPGLRLGAVSGNLHDLDCDDERLVPFLSYHAPAWAQECPSWGRGGRPHVLVRTSEAMAYRTFKYQGKTVLEIRGDGHQSLLPPAIHPTGTPYVWTRGPHQPDAVPGMELLEWVEDSVVSFALAQAWMDGSRHDIAMAFGGWVARRKIPLDRAKRITRCSALFSKDADTTDRERAVEDSFDRVHREEPATGWPTLERFLGADPIRLLREVWPKHETDGEERQGPYVARDGRLFFRTRDRDGTAKELPLANFDARITREVARDDGSGSVQRSLEIIANGAGGKRWGPIDVPSGDFAGLTWVIREFGAGAIVSAGQSTKDRTREGIQQLSRPEKLHLYTHTGWREVGGKRVFLHGGLLDEIRVDLEGTLAQYRLAPAEDTTAAIDASLRLLEVSDNPAISALWCGMYLAPLSEILRPDVTLWVWGPTGSLKSTLSALFLCHFGEFARKSLPCDWSWTDNALERHLFLAKDVPTVIDEFAPSSDRFESQKQISKGLRIVRAQGNHSGRGRMRADTSLRPAYPPRGVLLTTAEMAPPFPASAVARTLDLELLKEGIDLRALSQAQADARLLPGAMTVFVEWVGERYERLSRSLPDLFAQIRAEQSGSGHRRTPEIVANLLVAATAAMQAFVESGLSQERADSLLVRIKADLVALGSRQDQEVGHANPATKFLDVLRESFAKKTIYCQGRDGRKPPDGGELGWAEVEVSDNETGSEMKSFPARGAGMIGWADEDWLYLMPEESFRVVTKFLSEANQGLGATKDSLHRGLQDLGLIEGTPGREPRRTRLATVEGSQHRVLKLRRDAVNRSGGASGST